MNALNTSLVHANHSNGSLEGHVNHVKNNEKTLMLPCELKARYAVDLQLQQQIAQHRQSIENILNGSDSRLMIITGPCSIHDPIAVLDYAQKLVKLQSLVSDQILFVMRAYIEKPRTTVGWKGFLYDPRLDGSSEMQLGLEQSRQLYLDIIQLGLPISSEILSPMATAYFDDLLAWGAIGARTSESQIHREISSQMPYSIGFKNGTDGSIQIALDAIQSASHTHHFMGMSQSGLPSILESQGNPHPHLILRGSNTGTNFQIAEIEKIREKNKGQLPALVVDCSHGNSSKNPLNQPEVLKQIIAERTRSDVRGVMLESFLVDGNQKISHDMIYGQSITDGCLGWDKTEQLYLDVAEQLRTEKIQQIA